MKRIDHGKRSARKISTSPTKTRSKTIPPTIPPQIMIPSEPSTPRVIRIPRSMDDVLTGSILIPVRMLDGRAVMAAVTQVYNGSSLQVHLLTLKRKTNVGREGDQTLCLLLSEGVIATNTSIADAFFSRKPIKQWLRDHRRLIAECDPEVTARLRDDLLREYRDFFALEICRNTACHLVFNEREDGLPQVEEGEGTPYQRWFRERWEDHDAFLKPAYESRYAEAFVDALWWEVCSGPYDRQRWAQWCLGSEPQASVLKLSKQHAALQSAMIAALPNNRKQDRDGRFPVSDMPMQVLRADGAVHAGTAVIGNLVTSISEKQVYCGTVVSSNDGRVHYLIDPRTGHGHEFWVTDGNSDDQRPFLCPVHQPFRIDPAQMMALRKDMASQLLASASLASKIRGTVQEAKDFKGGNRTLYREQILRHPYSAFLCDEAIDALVHILSADAWREHAPAGLELEDLMRLTVDLGTPPVDVAKKLRSSPGA